MSHSHFSSFPLAPPHNPKTGRLTEGINSAGRFPFHVTGISSPSLSFVESFSSVLSS